MAKRGVIHTSTSNADKHLEEIEAQRNVYLALRALEKAAQLRVLRNSADMLELALSIPDANQNTDSGESFTIPIKDTSSTISSDSINETSDDDGVNPVALKWIRRSGFDPKNLQSLFSLGIDEIDLVAKTIPGRSVRDRLRNVLLLKCIAAYLSSGVARVSDEQLREAASHYNAYDQSNFSTQMRSLAAEVGGAKTNGYTLTARGLSSATELIREMLLSK
ncbi:MAG: hypothetical protein Q7T55_09630 [Solirubrobacteraceae bacterium]|nr:hypothetical protein [Solirubrobacteraceae bacterium]